ncbi:hypothetical protein PSEUDO8AS_10433 [Pseudomonas sp. 8AS]|nr:hypothetical protein PSEUDO8AS_10433 [Pseudomonas sp. 8AS]
MTAAKSHPANRLNPHDKGLSAAQYSVTKLALKRPCKALSTQNLQAILPNTTLVVAGRGLGKTAIEWL